MTSADKIEWNILRDRTEPRYEFRLRNLTDAEVAAVAQIVAALQRKREIAEREAAPGGRMDALRNLLSLPLPQKDGQ